MRGLLAVLCAGLLSGCAAEWPSFHGAGDSTEHVRLADVPFYPQEGHRCGSAAMAMVLSWSGLDIKPAALETRFAQTSDPRRALMDSASHYGRLAYPLTGTAAMITELTAGHPVLVVQNLGVDSKPLWNCVVAVGFDRPQGQVILHAGNQAGKRMSLGLFERLWADSGQWGLVALKPGEVPAAARQPDYVKSAYALHRAGRYWEAVLAYDAGLSMWPGNADSLMGLGASLYLLGDRTGAADAYRTALATSADPTPAQAALEQIAAEQVLNQPPLPRPKPRPASGRRTVTAN